MLDIGLLKSVIDQVAEFMIGRPAFPHKPTKAEEASFRIFQAVAPSAASRLNPTDARSLRHILDEVRSVRVRIDEILETYGVETAGDNKDGQLTVAAVASRLRDAIDLRVNRWSPKIPDHDADSERQWAERDLCLVDLRHMRVEVGVYLDTLAFLARKTGLSDEVPAPRKGAFPATALEQPEPPSWPDKPKKSMVRWLDPVELIRIAFADRRAKKIGRTTGKPGGYVKIDVEPGHDGGEFWVDYVSDLGDAIDPTLAVAWLMTEPALELAMDGIGELPRPPPRLPRGALLVMGGDEVYPYATARRYQRQLVLPYRMAGDLRDPGRDPKAAPSRNVVAIPGNHDWLGDIAHFEDVFVERPVFADHWRAPQDQRWWAIELIGGWWMWGIDTGLDDTVDEAQIDYFRAAAAELGPRNRVIVCSPVPLWQLRQKRNDEHIALRTIIDGLIEPTGADSPLFLAGDSHFFAEYRRVDGQADEHHITAGGGGAFLQPTHNLVEQVPSERGRAEFKMGARWPRAIDSRDLGAGVGVLRDHQFRALFAIVAAMHVGFGALVTIGYDGADIGGSLVGRARAVLRRVLEAWPGWPLLLLLVAASVVATIPNSQEQRLKAAARRYGVIHGVAEALGFVAIATIARVIGPDSAWWRLALMPLVGGVISTAMLVTLTRWINRSIKANDTVAYSSAHLTRYKHFVRMCFSPNGDLRLYVIGVDPVGAGWYEALSKAGSGSVPPADPAGQPSVHYVWGREFLIGSEEWLFEREQLLGPTHPDTISTRRDRVDVLLDEGRILAAVALAEVNLEACTARFDKDHSITIDARERLADARLRAARIDEAIIDYEAVLTHRTAEQHTAEGDHGLRLAAARTRARLGAARCAGVAGAGSTLPLELVAALEVDEHVATACSDPFDDVRRLRRLLLKYGATADSEHAVAIATLEGELLDCETELGEADEITAFARHLLAARHRQAGHRDEALRLLEANTNDYLSLQHRRGMAADADVEPAELTRELERLVVAAKVAAQTDPPSSGDLLVPVWKELAEAMVASGDTAAAVEQLQECFDETGAEDVRRRLDDLRTVLGLGPSTRAVRSGAEPAPATPVFQPPRAADEEGKAGLGSRLSPTAALAMVAVVAVVGISVVALSGLGGGDGKALVPADEVLPVTAVAPSAPTAESVQPPPTAGASVETAEAQLVTETLPKSQGRNVAVFALASDEATGDAAEIFSERYAAGLAGRNWNVWGPQALADAGVDIGGFAEMVADADSAMDGHEVDTFLGDRNIDIAIFGTLDGSSRNSIITLHAWFRHTVNGVNDAGLSGLIELFDNAPRGTTRAIDLVAVAESERLGPLLDGLSEFSSASLAAHLDAAKSDFQAVLQGAPTQDTTAFRLVDLARLYLGAIEVFRATAIATSEGAARYAPLNEAESYFTEASQSPSPEVSVRGFIGLAQVWLLRSPCRDAPFDDGVERAGEFLKEARKASGLGLPGPQEIDFRLKVLESTIEFCQWKVDGEPEPAHSRMNDLINEYEARRSAEERDRVQFEIASVYGRRGLIRLSLDDRQTDGELDLVKASCLAREFSRGVWDAELAERQLATSCLGGPGDWVAEPKQAE